MADDTRRPTIDATQTSARPDTTTRCTGSLHDENSTTAPTRDDETRPDRSTHSDARCTRFAAACPVPSKRLDLRSRPPIHKGDDDDRTQSRSHQPQRATTQQPLLATSVRISRLPVNTLTIPPLPPEMSRPAGVVITMKTVVL